MSEYAAPFSTVVDENCPHQATIIFNVKTGEWEDYKTATTDAKQFCNSRPIRTELSSLTIEFRHYAMSPADMAYEAMKHCRFLKEVIFHLYAKDKDDKKAKAETEFRARLKEIYEARSFHKHQKPEDFQIKPWHEGESKIELATDLKNPMRRYKSQKAKEKSEKREAKRAEAQESSSAASPNVSHSSPAGLQLPHRFPAVPMTPQTPVSAHPNNQGMMSAGHGKPQCNQASCVAPVAKYSSAAAPPSPSPPLPGPIDPQMPIFGYPNFEEMMFAEFWENQDDQGSYATPKAVYPRPAVPESPPRFPLFALGPPLGNSYPNCDGIVHHGFGLDLYDQGSYAAPNANHPLPAGRAGDVGPPPPNPFRQSTPFPIPQIFNGNWRNHQPTTMAGSEQQKYSQASSSNAHKSHNITATRINAVNINNIIQTPCPRHGQMVTFEDGSCRYLDEHLDPCTIHCSKRKMPLDVCDASVLSGKCRRIR